MLHGGLPPFFLADRVDDKDSEEWMSSYWGKDLSELFVVEKRAAFLNFVELLFAQSGGLFEAQAFAAPCEISRPTVQHYLSILETTLLATVLRPYHGAPRPRSRRSRRSMRSIPGSSSTTAAGRACATRIAARCLEHLVLGELATRFGVGRVHYWRDKQQHEVDSVLELGRRREAVAIECKSAAQKLDPAGVQAFRRKHPRGRNLLVTLKDTSSHARRFGAVDVQVVPYLELPAVLATLA